MIFYCAGITPRRSPELRYSKKANTLRYSEAPDSPALTGEFPNPCHKHMIVGVYLCTARYHEAAWRYVMRC